MGTVYVLGASLSNAFRSRAPLKNDLLAAASRLADGVLSGPIDRIGRFVNTFYFGVANEARLGPSPIPQMEHILS